MKSEKSKLAPADKKREKNSDAPNVRKLAPIQALEKPKRDSSKFLEECDALLQVPFPNMSRSESTTESPLQNSMSLLQHVGLNENTKGSATSEVAVPRWLVSKKDCESEETNFLRSKQELDLSKKEGQHSTSDLIKPTPSYKISPFNSMMSSNSEKDVNKTSAGPSHEKSKSLNFDLIFQANNQNYLQMLNALERGRSRLGI